MKVRTVKAALTALEKFSDFTKLITNFGTAIPMYVSKEKHELDYEPSITYVNITREINYQISNLKYIEVCTVGDLKKVLTKMPAKAIIRTQQRFFIDPNSNGELIDNIVKIGGDSRGICIG